MHKNREDFRPPDKFLLCNFYKKREQNNYCVTAPFYTKKRVLHGNVWGKFLFSEQANKLPRRGRDLACPTYDRAEHYETYVTFAA